MEMIIAKANGIYRGPYGIFQRTILLYIKHFINYMNFIFILGLLQTHSETKHDI